MSAFPKQPEGGLAGLRMTAEAFLALGETPERLELIDGVTTVSPSPIPLHQMVIQAVAYQITSFARAQTSADERPRMFIDTDVRFDKRIVYRPDVSVYAAGRLTGVPPRLELPPDLIIEVLSDSTRGLDMVTKRHDYERFGVREYWVIDPETLAVHAWHTLGEGASMQEARPVGSTLASGRIRGFVLNLNELQG